MANARIMKVATTFAQRKLFFHLHRECQRLERDGKEADSKEIADRLAISEKVVTEMRTRLSGREVQFETTVAVDSGPLHERVDGVSGPERPDDLIEEHQLRTAVKRKLAEVAPDLDTRELAIIEERLLAEKPVTLRTLGERFGVSRERTRQIEERLKKRLQPLFVDLYDRSPDTEAPAPALVA
jgi:RNA polymerase sigma-32 factor